MIVGARVAPVFKIDTAKAHASISPRSEKNAIVMAGAVCFASWWVNLRFVLLGTRQTEGKEGCKIRRFFLFGHGSTNYRYNIPSLSLLTLPSLYTRPFLVFPSLRAFLTTLSSASLQFPPLSFLSIFTLLMLLVFPPVQGSHLRSSPPSTSFQLLSRRVSEEMLLEGIRRGAHGSSPVVALH